MEDLQPMVASQASNLTHYPSTQHEGYNAVGADPNTYTAGNPSNPAYGSTGMVEAPAITEGSGADPAYGSTGMVEAPATENLASNEYTTEQTVHAVDYASFNGGTSDIANSASAENGNASAVDPQLGDVSGISSEEDRLWSLVKANCLDFNAWTSLIQETEKESNIVKIRKVYDSFLAEFPLCYGYWKKYADHEAPLGVVDKVVDVYERAVLAVTYSVDIWVHYSQFTISTQGDPENIRRLFERGLAYVGTDYLSSPLWDEYINYEYALQDWSRVAMIYTRILENPIQQLDRYFNSFKEFVATRSLSELRSAEDSATSGPSVEVNEQGTEGEVRPDGSEETFSSGSAGLTEQEELEKYISVREEMYKKAKEYDSKIINFETAIRRPYFHVRPLDEPELENWHNYLDFIERGDDLNKVVKLYERCLIACANYPEYWIRYVLCMDASGSMELANNALARATQVFVKKQPDIHLFAARFKERHGDVPGARSEYEFLRSEHSTALIEAIVRHSNMEYRLGNKDDAFSVYEEAIAAERAKDFSQVLPWIFVQYSRFSVLVAGDVEKARGLLTTSIETTQMSKSLLEAIIHLESLVPSPKKIDYLDSLVEKFITPTPDNSSMASTSDREDISCIYLEFLDLFGDSMSIKKAEDRHFMLFLRHRNTLVSRKRRSDDYLGSEKAKMSKLQIDDPSGQSISGAYPNAQNPWSASYGHNPPAWPQVPQAQAQQWNPGYAPQVGYSGYGTYPPQVPASVPQAASYGAYPSTSSVQVYPQPSYGTATPSTAYAQPAAPAAQAYYGNYY